MFPYLLTGALTPMLPCVLSEAHAEAFPCFLVHTYRGSNHRCSFVCLMKPPRKCFLVCLVLTEAHHDNVSRLLTEASHVDGCAVLQSQDDLRGSVEAGLDVRVDPLVSVARASKVDDLYTRGAAGLE